MNKRIIIAGHGLAGCVLALTCHRRNIPFIVYGVTQPGEASMASSGLINPITGRRFALSWMIDELILSSRDFYGWSEQVLGQRYFFPVEIIRLLHHPEALKAWQGRLTDELFTPYISDKQFDTIDFVKSPYGVVTGAYKLYAAHWIQQVRRFLSENNLLIEQLFTVDQKRNDHDVVIWSDGALHDPLPPGIIPNKGEALLVKLDGFQLPAILKGEAYIVPWDEPDVYWIGSNYERWPAHPDPTEEGKSALLKSIEPFYPARPEVLDHMTGIRPTTKDRRPLVGIHPQVPGDFILNGMGTKGTSLAPFWADKLLDFILHGQPLPKAVNSLRFNSLN